MAQDESSIKAFFEKYANADFDDPETRDTVLSYFIDKIYLYDDGHFKVTGWYWDFEHEIKSDLFEDLPERASGFEYSLDLDPEGFACFADGGGMVALLSDRGIPRAYVDLGSGYCEVGDGWFRPTRGYDPQGSMRAVEERAAALAEECPLAALARVAWRPRPTLQAKTPSACSPAYSPGAAGS